MKSVITLHNLDVHAVLKVLQTNGTHLYQQKRVGVGGGGGGWWGILDTLPFLLRTRSHVTSLMHGAPWPIRPVGSRQRPPVWRSRSGGRAGRAGAPAEAAARAASTATPLTCQVSCSTVG